MASMRASHGHVSVDKVLARAKGEVLASVRQDVLKACLRVPHWSAGLHDVRACTHQHVLIICPHVPRKALQI